MDKNLEERKMAGPDYAGAADTGRTRKVLRAAVLPEGDGEKLERYLRKNLEFTRAQIRSMKFRPDGIVVNGRRTRVSYILQAGDVLELRLEVGEIKRFTGRGRGL